MVFFAGMGRFGLYAAAVLWRMVVPPFEVHETARHTWLLLVRCLPPVVAVVFPMGMVMALQGLGIFEMFGTEHMLPSLVSVAVFRELSPVLATALVTAQGGSAFAAEIGAMRIKEEIDATEVMAIDPLRVHVVPRVAAAILATPVLNLIGSLAGIAGGWFAAVMLEGQPGGPYWGNVWDLTQPADLLGGIAKTVVFGLMIGLIATHRGYTAQGGAPGVGRAVNDTAVLAITTVIIANYFLTSALFGAGL